MTGREEVVWVQLATRIPKALHRELKLHCVTAETSVMDFVVKALEEKLARSGGAPKRRGAKV
jgi:predicted HicB family RNase H-like nuclease